MKIVYCTSIRHPHCNEPSCHFVLVKFNVNPKKQFTMKMRRGLQIPFSVSEAQSRCSW